MILSKFQQHWRELKNITVQTENDLKFLRTPVRSQEVC